MSEPLGLRSRLLQSRNVRHAFSTRHGGVSQGAFASLNLGPAVGDEIERVAENLRRFASDVHIPVEQIFMVKQVHGSVVHPVGQGDVPLSLRALEGTQATEADALVTRTAGAAVGVRVADCVPVLLHEARTGAVAAVHAGWRGVVAGVVSNAVAALAVEASGRPQLVAAIGPCIGSCCFAVGDDVADAIECAVPVPDARVIQRAVQPAAKAHVDLRLAVRWQLRALGLADDAIEDVGACTQCEPQRYFSHRRDGGHTGRMLALIVAGASVC